MRIQSSLAKGVFAEKRKSEAESDRMKAYNDRFMRLLKRTNAETVCKEIGKEGSR